MESLKTLFIFSLIIILLSFALISCNPSLPIYQYGKSDDKDGPTVIINNVKYKTLPELKWSVDPGNVIGYAGSFNTKVLDVKGDSDSDFIYLHDNGADMYNLPLYRTDKIIPEPSSESVDKIKWIDYMIGSDSESYVKTIEDKEIIKELFSALDNGQKTGKIEPLVGNKIGTKDISMQIICYSSQLPCARYELDVGINSGKLVCSDFKDLYVEVPLDLLEKISGKHFDIDGYQP